MTYSKIRVLCQKGEGGSCNQPATRVLVYINATTFQEIREKPKYLCLHHSLQMHVVTRAAHGIKSRLYTVDEWERMRKEYEQERRSRERR